MASARHVLTGFGPWAPTIQSRTGLDPPSWTPDRSHNDVSEMAKSQRVYTLEFRRQRVELHRAGRGPDELAKEFGCTGSPMVSRFWPTPGADSPRVISETAFQSSS